MSKVLNDALMDGLMEQARQSERGRAHYNMHESLDEDVHRLMMAFLPESRFDIQRHPGKWELLIALRGKFELFIYTDSGEVVEKHLLSPAEGESAVEIPPGTFHRIAALEPAVVLEVKKGPYIKPGVDDTLVLAGQ